MRLSLERKSERTTSRGITYALEKSHCKTPLTTSGTHTVSPGRLLPVQTRPSPKALNTSPCPTRRIPRPTTRARARSHRGASTTSARARRARHTFLRRLLLPPRPKQERRVGLHVGGGWTPVRSIEPG